MVPNKPLPPVPPKERPNKPLPPLPPKGGSTRNLDSPAVSMDTAPEVAEANRLVHTIQYGNSTFSSHG